MKERVNSYHVARIAGVSRSVVSLVYHGKADKCGITKKTQERVRAAIRQTGYKLNMFIRDLFLKRRELIGVAGADEVPDPVSLKAMVEPPLAAAGYRLQVASLSPDPETALAQVREMLGSGAACLIAPVAGKPPKAQG